MLLGAGYLALFVGLLTVWRDRSHSAPLAFALVASAIWSTILAFTGPAQAAEWTLSIFAIEVLRLGLWVLVLGQVLMTLGHARRRRLVSQLALPFVIVALVLAATMQWVGAIDGSMPSYFGVATAGLALIGFALVEQIYRNAPPASRWALKLICLGLAVTFLYDVVMSSMLLANEELARDLYLTRGFVLLATLPLLLQGFRRNPSWSLTLFVSRQAVVYTAATTMVVVYVGVVLVGALMVGRLGQTWGSYLQILLFTVAIILLVMALASRVVSNRINVFVEKHFYQARYDYRRELLRFVATMAEVDFDRPIQEVAVQALGQLVESPSGLLWARSRNADGWHVVSAWNMEPPDLSLSDDDDLPRFLESRQWLVEVPEYEEKPDTYGGMRMPPFASEKPRTWLIVPMLYEDELVSFVTLHEPTVSMPLNFEDRDLLKAVGRLLATGLLKDEADRRLDETRELDAYNKFTTFVMHDLNNVIAQLSLVVSNAANHKDNPRFVEDTFNTIENTVKRMTSLMAKLRSGEIEPGAKPTNIVDIAKRAAESCRERRPFPTVQSGTSRIEIIADGQRLLEILEHVIRNAQEATDGRGEVSISLSSAGGYAVVAVSDTGVGMTRQFVRNDLFRLFRTTKGAEGMGIGMYQLREYVRSIHGSVHVDSEPGVGTTVELRIPVRSSDVVKKPDTPVAS